MRTSVQWLMVCMLLVIASSRARAADCSITTTRLIPATKAAGAGTPQATPAVPASVVINITAAYRLAVSLSNPPSTRLRLSFDGVKGGHTEVDWDPTVSAELGHTVTLSPDAWTVSASVEPLTYTQSAGSVIVQTQFDVLSAETRVATASLQGSYVALLAALGSGRDTEQRTMDMWAGPALKLTCVELPSLEDTHFAAAPAANAASGLRGFGLAPAAVSDTLSIVAEIAVERAKTGALDLLKHRFIDPFCTAPSKVTLAKLHLGFSDELALPRTCELLSSVRLDDILSSGRPLLVALRDDLRRTIAPAAITQIASNDGLLQTVLQTALSVANAAIDHGGIDALDSQLALELLGNPEKLGLTIAAPVLADIKADLVSALDALSDADRAAVAAALSIRCPAPCTGATMADGVLVLLQKPFALSLADAKVVTLLRALLDHHETLSKLVGDACQARLAVAVLKRCQHDSCSAQELAEMIGDPASYFTPDTKLPFAMCWRSDAKTYRMPDGEIADVARLVSDGLKLVAPVVDGKGRDRARALVRLLADVIKRWRPDERVRGYIDSFAEITDALIDQDYGTALNAFLTLAGKVQPGKVPAPVRKVVQLLGAVSSYRAVYSDTKDADPKAAREARKQALEGLIDQATDRHGRDGEMIVSIGSNVGLSATWTDGVRDTWGAVEPSLRVPLGVTIDIKQTGPIALHVGVLLADLGQFVHHDDQDTLKPVHWDDFVSPGLELGVALPGLLDRKLNLSVHAAFAPSLPQDMNGKAGVWRYGISIGYYVPFFDFN
jgi:hypothetical protein